MLPPAIDFEHTEGVLRGHTWQGIYALDGDSLTICDDAPDVAQPRPAAFDASNGYIVLTFRRAR